MELSDAAELWGAYCERGDLSAAEQLYRAFRPEVFRYSQSILGDSHGAEDATQTAFAQLLARRPALRSDFRRLLLATARNICRNELRRVRLHTEAAHLKRLSQPANLTEGQDDITVLQDCLRQLSERDRSLIALTASMGHSNRAAARHLGWTASDATISRRLKSIRAAILCSLKKKGIFSANS